MSIIVSLGVAFFFAELVIGPMWSIPMDIAGTFSGTAAGMMNTGSALAAILSPIAFGYIIDRTGNWQLPFAGSLGFLLVGALLSSDPVHRKGLSKRLGNQGIWSLENLVIG